MRLRTGNKRTRRKRWKSVSWIWLGIDINRTTGLEYRVYW